MQPATNRCGGVPSPPGYDAINAVAIVKNEERYIILYSDRWAGEAYRTLGRWASNKELSFSWHDAAILSEKIRLNAEVAK